MLELYDLKLRSRLLLGTARYPSPVILEQRCAPAAPRS